MRRPRGERGGGMIFAGALAAAGILMVLFAASGRPRRPGTVTSTPQSPSGSAAVPSGNNGTILPLPAEDVEGPDETATPDTSLPLPGGAEPPPADDGSPEVPNPPSEEPQAGLRGTVAAGQGQPTEFQVNRKAVLHVGDRRIELPVVLWFDHGAAPDGDTPFTFHMKPGGAGYHEFLFAVPNDGPVTPCRFTDPAGNPLEVLDVKFSVEALPDDRVRSIFKLQLVKP